MSSCARAPTPRRSTRSCRPGRSATSPTRSPTASAPIPATVQDFALVNVRDVHLGKAQRFAMTPGNDRAPIATFAIVALLILGMACVNFTNLATARASQRAREVALRKVLGANRAAADRPVHRRIDAGRGDRDADRAGAGRTAAAGLQRLPRCRDPRSIISARTACCCPIARARPARRRRRRPLSGLLSVAVPAGARAEGQQVGAPTRRDRAAAQHPGGRPVRGVDRR